MGSMVGGGSMIRLFVYSIFCFVCFFSFNVWRGRRGFVISTRYFWVG